MNYDNLRNLTAIMQVQVANGNKTRPQFLRVNVADWKSVPPGAIITGYDEIVPSSRS